MTQPVSLPKHRLRLHTAVYCVFIVMSLSVLATTARAEGAHEHGIADLLIAVDNNAIMVRLESPAANLLGFETAPESDQDRATARQLINDLEKGGLIRIKDAAGQCTVTSPSWSTELFTEASLDVTAASTGDDHAHDHHHNDDNQHPHADMDIEWQAQCNTVPVRIEHTLFTRFEALHDLRISLIDAQGQRAWKVDSSGPQIITLDGQTTD